ncbi:hypothetical protein BX666DRAFT_1858840 [Dichotomocladium elegans]|nr:hypothetical protein BX666DRAFT_1858840 [Dichotomocladium elegans]
MLDCIHAGATDYLLKPLHLDVIKTLFLVCHRCRRHQHRWIMPQRYTPMMVCNTELRKSSQKIHGKKKSHRHPTILQHRIACWDFNPFDFNRNDLIHCVYLIFEQALVLPELSYLSFTDDQLYDFIIDLSGAYHDGNPYHNFAHAVDVLQCLYYFLCRLGLLAFANAPVNHTATKHLPRHNQLQYLLQPKHIFALLIAALGHDAAHPGVNNAFLVNSGSPLALLFSDRSVLESLHSMTLFQVLKKHGVDQVGGGPSSADYQEFRKIVVTSILATDMSHHNDYVEKIKAQADRIAKMDIEKLDSAARENERLLICNALIKCADISNVARPFVRAIKWAELLVEECVLQGDLERAMGLPSMPLNNRDKVVLEDSQIGFIKCVASGLFEVVREVLPDLSFAMDYINDNLKHWEERKQSSRDSGVPNLAETMTSGTTTTVRAGTKRRNSSLDYKAVEMLRKRLSLDNGRHNAIETVRRRSVGSIIPITEHRRRIRRVQPAYTLVDHHHHHHHHHHHESVPETSPSPSEWSRNDPANCQCSIQ